MSNKRIIQIICLALLVTSCKKESNDKDNTQALTTMEKIQQKWNLVSNLDRNYKGKTTNLDYIDTLDLGRPGDYLDFRSDMKAYYNAKSGLDTFTYKVLGDTELTLGSDAFSIQELTLSNFQFIYRVRNTDPYYDNMITLSR